MQTKGQAKKRSNWTLVGAGLAGAAVITAAGFTFAADGGGNRALAREIALRDRVPLTQPVEQQPGATVIPGPIFTLAGDASYESPLDDRAGTGGGSATPAPARAAASVSSDSSDTPPATALPAAPRNAASVSADSFDSPGTTASRPAQVASVSGDSWDTPPTTATAAAAGNAPAASFDSPSTVSVASIDSPSFDSPDSSA